MKLSTAFVALASVITIVQAGKYHRSHHVQAHDFNNFFEYQTIDDPTQGRVNYVDQQTAHKKGLTYVAGDSFVLRADYKHVVPNGARGRDSVRLRSKKLFRTHVAVFDVKHMPQGCGTWPAIWETLENGWPNGGEVDILEGVNDQGPNSATLHTTPGCSMPGDNSQMTGTWKQTDCNWLVNGNAGCGVAMNRPNTYGPAFNKNNGGVYALERTPHFMKVWFWPRGSNTPKDLGSGNIDTSNWGKPDAYFPNTNCNFDQHFSAENIIINLTFCGTWAGTVYPGSCPQSCDNHVINNPGAFKEAYFNIKDISIYE